MRTPSFSRWRVLSRRAGVARRGLSRRVRQGRQRRAARRATGSATLPAWPATVHDNVRHFTAPGAAFEEAHGLPPPAAAVARRARAIAFYLPQFHPFAENDRWWGKGFTEWRNVARGMPRFAGHYQPRVPRDLGHYDLERVETLREQAALARAAGIDAFCFYYYWFDGRRLMERPLDRFVESDIEQDFCILWANENWTRRWDGREEDVLIRQSYRAGDEDAFIADTARYLAHPRYLRVAGRPLFIVYRAADLPDPATTVARWRDKWRARLGVEPWILMAQTYDDRDPRVYGMDGAIEFPPHKLSRDLLDRTVEHRVLDAAFGGQVRAYADMVERALAEPAPPYPLVRTVAPHWDNDARRAGAGVTLHGSTPALYERWLEGAAGRARATPFAGEPLVFVNAWNEWAEGAYLEPDLHYGHACLNATRRVLLPDAAPPRAARLLLVGHDAHPNGAQMLLLALARLYAERFGLEVTVLLRGGGALLPRYRETAPTFVLEDRPSRARRRALRDFLDREAFPMAICNTSVSGSLVPALRASGTRVVSLIHEMPGFLRERALEGALEDIARAADHVVFAAELVREGFEALAPAPAGAVHILPQGVYRSVAPDARARERRRRALGIAPELPLVLGVGYADRRKGFDLFVKGAARYLAEEGDARFVWLGGRSTEMSRWLARRAGPVARDPRLRLEPFSDGVAEWLAAADCLFLSSREDPYPTVALEAMGAGLPVVSFAGATGLDALQRRFGTLVAQQEPAAAARALRAALEGDDPAARAARVAYVAEHCRLEDYAARLLGLLDPARRPPSAA